MDYVTGETIRCLRERKMLTQKELAEQLSLSDKTISKWETGRGLPDVSVLSDLAVALGVSMAELFSGECLQNENRSGNVQKSLFYVCPICGNVVYALGRGAYSCCGVLLPPLEVEEEENHALILSDIDGQLHVSMEHPMEKGHFLSFFAYVTGDRAQIVKLYPEQSCETMFYKKGHGWVYAYCNRHGLFRKRV